MKCDANLFPNLDHLKNNNSWGSNTLDAAASQDVKDIFDENYSPTPGMDEETLFNKKMEFVCTVFNNFWLFP